jgi:hypothetical protein
MATVPAIMGTARLGNFRLGYQPAALRVIRQTKVRILLAGTDVSVRVAGLSIRDVLNDTPNSCTLTIDHPAPTSGQALRITINSDAPRLLFAGTIQTDDLTYEGKPTQLVYPCTAIDDTGRANKKRPFGTWTNISATTVAQALVSAFAPGFSAAGVVAALPTVTITFDGSTSFMGCLAQLATLIGGYCNAEDGVVSLFLTDTSDPPDAIDSTPGRFLDDPPITVRRDDSQLATRVYGKGHAEPVLVEVAASETVLPVRDAVMYNPAGGRVIASTTPDGAASERLVYTGVILNGPGTVVGPGVSPSVAPVLALSAGAGLGAGAYQYAFTWVTAAGESLPSPLAAITTGVTLPPASPPAPVAPSGGAGLDIGTHDYQFTFTNASGETTPSPISGSVVIQAAVTPPAAAPTIANDTGGSAALYWSPGDTLFVQLVYLTGAGGITTPTASSNSVVATLLGSGQAHALAVPIVASSDPRVSQNRVYVSRNGSWLGYSDGANATFTAIVSALVAGSPPGVNTAVYAQVPVFSVATGPPAVTARTVYRRFNGTGTFKLVTTIADNTTTAFVDTIVNASLGAAAPSSNTATAAQVATSGIALGPTGTTQRKVYRTVVDGAQLKLQQTIANNTATVGVTDATADGSLGANAPVTNTSGLVQAFGQVNPGATTIPTAGVGMLAPSGWVLTSAGEIVRYTGVSGNTLTGIPASGVGAILTAIFYGDHVTPVPALSGVTGLTTALAKDAPVHIWVQRDDLDAQAEAAARESTPTYTSDGIHEVTITDERRGEASLIQRCDAHLQLFARPLVEAVVAVRDVKVKSGKPLTFNLASPPISETLTIQEVVISEIDVAIGLPPRFTVTASSVRFSLEDLLRKMVALL